MRMKIFFVFVFAATVILLGEAQSVFANSDTRARVCSNAVNECPASQAKQADNTELEMDPFTILIPGNHF
jgi:hypothetical protein